MGSVRSMEAKIATDTESASSLSGSGMDRRIEVPAWRWQRWAGIAALVIVLIGSGLWMLDDVGTGKALNVNGQRLTISSVTAGTFEDFIPVRARVTPFRTVFLDAIEGGRVERVLVEDGIVVEAGQLIAELSNTGLQIDVTRNEALITEQLNNMRTIELQLEQNRLQHKRNLVEINYQIKRLGRLVERERDLLSRNAIPRSQFEDTEDELAYYQDRRTVTLESQATDSRLQDEQLGFLRTTATQLENNLAISRQNLDSLNVRAPVSGKLSGFDIEVGQSISRGGRLGQIDDPVNFKLSADIDEFYLGRVDIGQRASLDLGGQAYLLEVRKIYPQVRNGEFEVDLVFVDAVPAGIRRGQTAQLKLTLGDSSTSLLIPNGAFYQDTGGSWLFVVVSDGSRAVRREVRLGRRNSRFIEVIEGLEEGEQVITSPYSGFKDMDRLRLTGQD